MKNAQVADNWAAALHDSIKPPEIAKGIELVKSGRPELEAFASSGELPSPGVTHS